MSFMPGPYSIANQAAVISNLGRKQRQLGYQTEEKPEAMSEDTGLPMFSVTADDEFGGNASPPAPRIAPPSAPRPSPMQSYPDGGPDTSQMPSMQPRPRMPDISPMASAQPQPGPSYQAQLPPHLKLGGMRSTSLPEPPEAIPDTEPDKDADDYSQFAPTPTPEMDRYKAMLLNQPHMPNPNTGNRIMAALARGVQGFYHGTPNELDPRMVNQAETRFLYGDYPEQVSEYERNLTNAEQAARIEATSTEARERTQERYANLKRLAEKAKLEQADREAARADRASAAKEASLGRLAQYDMRQLQPGEQVPEGHIEWYDADGKRYAVKTRAQQNKENALERNRALIASVKMINPNADTSALEGVNLGDPGEFSSVVSAIKPPTPKGKTPLEMEQEKDLIRYRHQFPSSTVANVDKEYMQRLARDIAGGAEIDINKMMSLRSGDRAILTQMIRDINPDWTPGAVTRSLDIEKSLSSTDPKSIGGQLTSFGTFLRHTKGLQDAAQAMSSDTFGRWLARPINELKQGAVGNPELTRLKTALDPVQKEFQKFLLGGYALQENDRVTMQHIVDGNATLGELKAMIKTASNTAVERLDELNNQYRRTKGRDIKNPLSQEAVEAAKSIGLKLPEYATRAKQAGAGKGAATPAGVPPDVWASVPEGRTLRTPNGKRLKKVNGQAQEVQ